MAGIVPTTKLGKIEFFENHVAPWTSNVTAIGLVIGDVTAVDTAAAAARAAYEAQQLAQQAAKVATQDLDAKLQVLQVAGSTAIQKVRAKATAAGDGADAVYTLAAIPAPLTPSPVGPPGTPTDLKVTLNPDGSLVLNWKCANPPGAVGTIYNLRRKPEGASAFTVIGASGARTFTDDTLPAGSGSVVYEITAVRSTRSGVAAPFLVMFGVSDVGGEAFASVADATPAKLAA